MAHQLSYKYFIKYKREMTLGIMIIIIKSRDKGDYISETTSSCNARKLDNCGVI